MTEKQSEGKATVSVELLHPVTHDFVEYSRGLHEVTPELAEKFLLLRAANRVDGPQPVGRVPQAGAAVAAGVLRPAADAPEEVVRRFKPPKEAKTNGSPA